MSKEKIIELIVCILAIAVLVLSITSNVFATDADDLLGETTSNKNTNTNQNIPEVNNTNKNTNTNTNKNNTNVNNTNKNNTNNNTNKNVTAMPNTGVDYSVITIITICGISTVYAYKKIRDYKNV